MLSLAEIKRLALEVGFDDCGVARADALTDDEYPLREWLARGWHAGLGYMERNVEKRMDPRLLVPGARSVICVVSAYGPPDPGRNDGVAAYAQRREYHEVMKPMLQELKRRLGVDGKVCCDTVPISDKHWAARAGLGWIGRHTLLVTPRWGSWVNLGEIVTTAECNAYDSPLRGKSVAKESALRAGSCESRVESKLNCSPETEQRRRSQIIQIKTNQPNKTIEKSDLGDLNRFDGFLAEGDSPTGGRTLCERCGRCVEACPNGAIAADGAPMLNLNRCTAYYNTHIQRPLPPDVDARGYTLGCDLCQLACPFNS